MDLNGIINAVWLQMGSRVPVSLWITKLTDCIQMGTVEATIVLATLVELVLGF